MQKYCLLFCSMFFLFVADSQQKSTSASKNKPPLNHTVYDSWESIGEKLISNNGEYVAYTINVQEGNNTLYVQKSYEEKVATKMAIPRGYNASFSADGNYLVCKIKPTYEQIREAKIKKKKPDEMPKDSMAIVTLANMSIQKIARVKSFLISEENNWLAWLHEKNELDKKADAEEGTMLFVKNFSNNKIDSFNKISSYLFDKNGNTLVLDRRGSKKDSLLKNAAIWVKLNEFKADTLLKNYADTKRFVLDETGNQLAFVATFDTTKTEQKDYNLYQYNQQKEWFVFKNEANGLPTNWRINENATISFSKSGNRLLFGTSPKIIAKDTSLPEFERVSVDVWHYNDDELQTVQLKNNDANLKRSYTAIVDVQKNKIVQLGNEEFTRVQIPLEGDATVAYSTSNLGKRVASQWQGFTYNDVYAIDVSNGNKKLIKTNLKGNIYPSYTGKYLVMYDEVKKKYEVYNHSTGVVTPFAKDIPYPLYDEDNDVPDDANAYGIVKWMEADKYVLIYDRYDVWKVDPTGKEKSIAITNGRKEKVQHRYLSVDEDEKFITPFQNVYFRIYDEVTKASGVLLHQAFVPIKPLLKGEENVKNEERDSSKTFAVNTILFMQPGIFREANPVVAKNTTTKTTSTKTVAGIQPKLLNSNILSNINSFIKAKNSRTSLFVMEDYAHSPNLYVGYGLDTSFNQNLNDSKIFDTTISLHANQLTKTNPQQENYNWGTAELFTWKAYTGKQTEGIIYKPENFDSTKKYPMIVYFYERSNNTLHNYIAPAPTPSRLNISFFVSRGYIVFVPDIWYKTGKPGQSAYDYIVSGTRAVVKKGYVDSTKMGLQGQSWGGYQIAHLITRTNLYAAAWAGAPVANMTSAYGGIRWGSGLTRQFQYEKTQSRIGATLWERPDLYIENSPLFHLPKVKTPLVIMHNDKDDAVPWYQGIELFTGLRRLGKKVWMLNYNDDLHNLMERRNRKDIQIREQQFFDWLLKGEKPSPWLEKGVPAIMKGRTLGL